MTPKQLENRACAALVHELPFARRELATALRAWRRAGNRVRAHWLLYHASYIGWPTKDPGPSQAWSETHCGEPDPRLVTTDYDECS